MSFPFLVVFRYPYVLEENLYWSSRMYIFRMDNIQINVVCKSMSRALKQILNSSIGVGNKNTHG
jgi:hypothetical protein